MNEVATAELDQFVDLVRLVHAGPETATHFTSNIEYSMVRRDSSCPRHDPFGVLDFPSAKSNLQAHTCREFEPEIIGQGAEPEVGRAFR
jgi:hypothetical protein